MLTQDEVKRLAGRLDGSVILDPDFKSELTKEHLKQCVGKIESKLKRTKGKVVVFFGEVK